MRFSTEKKNIKKKLLQQQQQQQQKPPVKTTYIYTQTKMIMKTKTLLNL